MLYPHWSHFQFFFSSSDTPLDLHSFPTRRSSDLAFPSRIFTYTSCRTSSASSRWRRQQARAQLKLAAWSRSEEHTSELQSRRDLVCRLLLEKKKKTS